MIVKSLFYECYHRSRVMYTYSGDRDRTTVVELFCALGAKKNLPVRNQKAVGVRSQVHTTRSLMAIVAARGDRPHLSNG